VHAIRRTELVSRSTIHGKYDESLHAAYGGRQRCLGNWRSVMREGDAETAQRVNSSLGGVMIASIMRCGRLQLRQTTVSSVQGRSGLMLCCCKLYGTA
jgi:hypothetical protein